MGACRICFDEVTTVIETNETWGRGKTKESVQLNNAHSNCVVFYRKENLSMTEMEVVILLDLSVRRPLRRESLGRCRTSLNSKTKLTIDHYRFNFFPVS